MEPHETEKSLGRNIIEIIGWWTAIRNPQNIITLINHVTNLPLNPLCKEVKKLYFSELYFLYLNFMYPFNLGHKNLVPSLLLKKKIKPMNLQGCVIFNSSYQLPYKLDGVALLEGHPPPVS